MTNIKSFVISQFRILSIIFVLTSMSIILLMFRIKITQSFFYLFLVWNIFLAYIPYAITFYLSSVSTTKNVKLLGWFIVWLLFLPNAPYILTDLWHLRLAESNWFWLDIIVFSSFAATGLLLFFLSIIDMVSVLQLHIKQVILDFLSIALMLLSSFGIYLGRFLRYNSWEVMSNPKLLISDIFEIIFNPYIHKEAWYFTIIFAVFLYVGFWVFKSLIQTSYKSKHAL